MKNHILTFLFTLAGLVGMAQTNQPLPSGAVPFGATTYLSPLDSTIWLYKERDGTAIKVANWVDVDSIILLLRITPNIFKDQGLNDTEKIQQALDLAVSLGQPLYIGVNDETEDALWLLDSAVLVSSGAEIEINNTTLKLSDSSRDNIFRGENTGFGITDPDENPLSNIIIRGVGRAVLEGADNPRSTGDSGKTLSLEPTENSNLTYGSDASDPGEKQTGDWRNIGVLFGYASDVEITGLTMNMLHSYCVSLERCHDVVISNITLNNPVKRAVEGDTVWCKNTDGINVRFSGQNVVIRDVFGHTGDDMVALTVLANGSTTAGGYSSVMVTGNIYDPASDDIYNVTVDNIQGYTYTNLVRLLNGAGTNMYNINISNITDISNTADSLYIPTTTGGDRSCIAIGSTISASWGAADLGSCYNININNVKSHRYDYGVKVGGSLSESFVRNINKQNDNGIPAFYAEPTSNGTRNVYLDGINSANADYWVSAVSNGINSISHLVSEEIADSISTIDLNRIMSVDSVTNHALTVSTNPGISGDIDVFKVENTPVGYTFRVNNRGEFFHRIYASSGDLIGRIMGTSSGSTGRPLLSLQSYQSGVDAGAGVLYANQDSAIHLHFRPRGQPSLIGASFLVINRLDSVIYAPVSTLQKINAANGRALITKDWANSTYPSLSGDNSFSGRLSAPQYRLSALNTAPASATATGTTGEIRVTATHIYVCIATDTWVRAALTTW